MTFLTLNPLTSLALLTETMILIGFISIIPILYFANLYVRYKRHKAATPWKVQDKVVVITGASSGIGASLAYEFARQGAILVLCSRRVDALANVAQECKEKHGATHVTIMRVDVTNESDLFRLVDTVEKDHSQIDCLVLNAGVSMGETLESLEEFDIIRKIMDVNYFGATELTYNAMPLLRKADKPRIVVVSSLIGIIPLALRTGYSASKFALRGFFESLQNELIDKNIFITMAYPSVVKTGINEARLGKNPKHLDFNVKDSMSADECAKIIVDGAVKAHKEIVFTYAGKFARVLEGAFPDLLTFLSHKKAKGYVYSDKTS